MALYRNLTAARPYRSLVTVAVLGFGLGLSAVASATQIQVTLTNEAPDQGVFLTPLWVGFHDGSFDLYDRGVAIGDNGLPSGLESIVEDGSNQPLMDDFAASSAGGSGGVDATIPTEAGPFAPGASASATFDVDSSANPFFSYASMVIPSNDAFIANGDPTAHPIFDEDGNVVPFDIEIFGPVGVLDGGTEVNTEEDAAFLNQTAPNTGVTENGTVELHAGFNGSLRNPDGTPVNILGGTNALGLPIGETAADFTQDGYQVATISLAQVEAVPEPAPLALMSLGLLALGFTTYRRGKGRA